MTKSKMKPEANLLHLKMWCYCQSIFKWWYWIAKQVNPHCDRHNV